ncbi:MAG UNVERIFIED_CONTAM: hypothetical protein LVR29_24990 [Microcystis novacekii LVE1205-3]|jgi:hypothetical protein
MIEEMFGEKDEQLKPKTQRFQEFLQKFNEFQKHQSPAAGLLKEFRFLFFRNSGKFG